MFYEPQRIKRSDIGSSLARAQIVPEGKVLVTALVGVVSHFQVKTKEPESKPAEHSSCTWHVNWHVFAICAVDSRLICGKRVPGLQIIQQKIDSIRICTPRADYWRQELCIAILLSGADLPRPLSIWQRGRA
jgi:hypothetical protein